MENAIEDSNAIVILDDHVPEKRAVELLAAGAAAVCGFDLTQNRSASADGWYIRLKIARTRREITVKLTELVRLADAGDEFVRLVDEVNKLLPDKSRIQVDRE